MVFTSDREFGRHAVLCATLILFAISLPLVSEGGIGSLILRWGTAGIMMASVFAASSRIRYLIPAVVLALPALSTQVAEPFGDWTGHVRLGFTTALMFYTAMLVLVSILRERITGDAILGGISVYLLIGIAFGFLHAWNEMAVSGSYQGATLSTFPGEPDVRTMGLFLYFSIVTMTTLGYGDIVPATQAARMLCAVEAVVGQLYVAIFIARLVAMYAGTRAKDAD